MSKLKHRIPTIGILPGWSGYAGKTPDRYLASVLKGIQSAAQVKGCHLLLAWGLGRVNEPNGIHPAWPIAAPNADFIPIGPWNTDGLIIFAPLRDPSRSRYLQELSAQGFPVLYIASGEQGFTISVDNAGGIYQAVAHLAEHGHRRIAFVSGDPHDTGDSAARLHSYHSAMAQQGLEIVHELIIPGWHTLQGGYQAMQSIIRSEIEFTALIASDDNSAIGAMQALREAGLQIPRDVAVIGFDDQLDTMAQVPPLASIHIPLAAMGEQALAMLFDHVANAFNLESIQIPTRLVPRQSCGCMPNIVSLAGRRASGSQSFISHSEESTEDIEAIVQRLVVEMVAILPAAGLFHFGQRTSLFCTRLVEAFYVSLKENDPLPFQMLLLELLQELELAEETIDIWQGMISVLRRGMTQLPGVWTQPRVQYLAEDLLHQARTAISESAQRQDHRHQYQREMLDQSLSELTAHLSAILDEQQLVSILGDHLPKLGLSHAHIVVFEEEAGDPVAQSRIINSQLQLTSSRFSTRAFPPPGLYSANELLNLAIIPLVFQEERLGYMAFDANSLGPGVIIARQIAATLKASQLHAQVLELSLKDPLTNLYNRRYFDVFLCNELKRSQRFDHDLCILMLDIDYFKQYNDTFGHLLGDKALQWVAYCLRQQCRGTDVVARIGGEEFAVILPETSMDGALQVAVKLRIAVTKSIDLPRTVTLSMGISVVQGMDITAEEIIRRADTALYQAKKGGRDRVCVFDPVNGHLEVCTTVQAV